MPEPSTRPGRWEDVQRISTASEREPHRIDTDPAGVIRYEVVTTPPDEEQP